MKTGNYLNKLTIIALILFHAALNSYGQTVSSPRQEKLLNGMRLLVWNEPKAEKAMVKLRVHSGAAFDPQGKDGTMALLADILFPDEAIREFFAEDLGGSIEVESTFDYIQITATGNNDQIITILETLSNAVIKPQIDKETTPKVRAARIAKVSEMEKTAAYAADQAVARRLLGNFPYGRSPEGTTESLQKIDFADLLLAKQKFLTADNTTLAVSGNVRADFVFRAVRQLFGGWEKADRRIPATFAQPNAPDTKFFLVKTEIDNAGELRFAFRGLARNDKDFYAAQILTTVLQNRLQQKEGGKAVLAQKSYFLPGLVILKLSDWDTGALKLAGEDVSLPENFLNYVENLLRPNVGADEFQAAKNAFLRDFSNQNNVEAWLNADTFQLAPVKNETQRAQTVAIADVQRVLERWRKEAVARTVLIKRTADANN